MQYILLVYDTTSRPEWNNLPNPEKRGLADETYDWCAELEKSGHLRGVNRLDLPSTATTFYERNGKSMITDGPFPETKEFLGGLEVLECRDLDEAMAIVKRFPGLPFIHCVELRPVAPFGQCRD